MSNFPLLLFIASLQFRILIIPVCQADVSLPAYPTAVFLLLLFFLFSSTMDSVMFAEWPSGQNENKENTFSLASKVEQWCFCFRPDDRVRKCAFCIQAIYQTSDTFPSPNMPVTRYLGSDAGLAAAYTCPITCTNNRTI